MFFYQFQPFGRIFFLCISLRNYDSSSGSQNSNGIIYRHIMTKIGDCNTSVSRSDMQFLIGLQNTVYKALFIQHNCLRLTSCTRTMNAIAFFTTIFYCKNFCIKVLVIGDLGNINYWEFCCISPLFCTFVFCDKTGNLQGIKHFQQNSVTIFFLYRHKRHISHQTRNFRCWLFPTFFQQQSYTNRLLRSTQLYDLLMQHSGKILYLLICQFYCVTDNRRFVFLLFKGIF